MRWSRTAGCRPYAPLAVELSINPNTIQRAYSELERTGFLYTVKGKGNYVAYSDSLKDVRKQEILEKLRDLKKGSTEHGDDGKGAD